ncbi:MAG TPA: Asp-tRNA(Asn)/Glu-tRNA(Gln) amidotransferase GatCAB subunit B, partial [Pseudomonadales bacterium]|nr:Asp-tRNA(Asn)/Glu-tRNA(Gln) amidotransferase GatCAB subunit B [Pseudomonadales bacterium]
LGALIAKISTGAISGKIAKTLFETLWNAGDTAADVDALIKSQGLEQVSDSDELAALIRKIVADNPAQVAQFRAGKEKVFGFFVGQAMQATRGRANPQRLNELLREALAAP